MPSTVISLPDRRDPNAIIKGAATDASMITAMKRQAAIVADARNKPSNGIKGTGSAVDGVYQRGFTDGPVRPVLLTRGLSLGFFRVN